MHTPEFWEKKAIDEYLKSIKAYNAKPSSGGFGASGTADRLVCIKGKFVAIEVKREGKEPTPIQLKRMREVRAAGGIAIAGTASTVIPQLKALFSA